MNKQKNKVMIRQMLDRRTVYSVSAKLMQHDIITAHPDVDLNGADLLAIMKIEDGAKFARIQCKGRTIQHHKSSCYIKIPKTYVTGTFTCVVNILYLVDNSEHCFCFFANDIKSRPDLWKDRSDYFSLSLYGNTFSKKADLFYFSNSRIIALKEMIKQSDMNKEFHNVFGKLAVTLPTISAGT